MFSISWVTFIVCALEWIQQVGGAKILIISLPAFSHVTESNAVAVELVKRGHHVTFYFPDNFDSSKCAPDISNIRYGHNAMSAPLAHVAKITKLASEGKITPISLMQGTRKALCDHLVNDTEGLEKLRKEKFDFALVDYIFYVKCYFLIPYNLSISYAAITSMMSELDVGQPVTTSITPFYMTPYSSNMRFHERFVNTLVNLWSVVTLDFFMEFYDYSKIAPGLSWKELQQLPQKAELFLENTDTILSYPKPLMPNIIQVGGLTVKPAKPLPTNIQHFFDDASHGVIIVSFGSVFKLSIPTQNIFMCVFQKLKQRIFWKRDDEKETGNILISKWLPQNDALAHPNTKLIIYHCGNNGMFESLYHGVPLLCIPQASDQFKNSRKLDYLKIGRFFDIEDLTEQLLREVIIDLLNDPKYTTNIKRLSEIYRSRLKMPTERAASALEHVIKYGGKHLRLDQVDFTAFQLLAVDVWFTIFVLLLVFIKLVIRILCICKQLLQPKSKVKQN